MFGGVFGNQTKSIKCLKPHAAAVAAFYDCKTWIAMHSFRPGRGPGPGPGRGLGPGSNPDAKVPLCLAEKAFRMINFRIL